jgi:hypothetical protein
MVRATFEGAAIQNDINLIDLGGQSSQATYSWETARSAFPFYQYIMRAEILTK